MVRPLNLPNHEEGDKNLPPPPRKIRSFDLPTEAATPVVEPPKVKTLNVGSYVPNIPQKKKERSQIDDLLDKVSTIDPNIKHLDIRAKIQTCLSADITGLLNWGDRNLQPMMNASNVQSDLINRMNTINASGWLKDTMDASCKRPGFLDNFKDKKGPDYYDAMIKKTRAELIKLVEIMNNLYKQYEPDVYDLHMDAVSLLVVIETITDDSKILIASNRAKSLQAAHMTAVMLLETIKKTKLQCASFVQQIDDLLTTTIPNWRMAYK